MAKSTAETWGGSADVNRQANPVTVNDPALTAKMLPTLQLAGPTSDRDPFVTGAEDFLRARLSSLVFVGVTPLDRIRPRHRPIMPFCG
jgi:hypothetical protein